MIKRMAALCGLTLIFAIHGMSCEKVVSGEQNKSLSSDYLRLLEKVAPLLDGHITLFNQSMDADNPQKGKVFFDQAIECLEEIQKIIYTDTDERLKIDLNAHLAWVYFKGAQSTSDHVLKETYVDYAGMLSLQAIKKARHADTYYLLAQIYAMKSELVKDVQHKEALTKESLVCAKKAAAEKGDVEAQFDVGAFYLQKCKQSDDRQEKKASWAKAIAWLKKAAKRNNSKAQNMLGCLMYEKAESLPENSRPKKGRLIIEAVHWLYEASRQGHSLAKNNLDMLCEKHPVEISECEDRLRVKLLLPAIEPRA